MDDPSLDISVQHPAGIKEDKIMLDKDVTVLLNSYARCNMNKFQDLREVQPSRLHLASGVLTVLRASYHGADTGSDHRVKQMVIGNRGDKGRDDAPGNLSSPTFEPSLS